MLRIASNKGHAYLDTEISLAALKTLPLTVAIQQLQSCLQSLHGWRSSSRFSIGEVGRTAPHRSEHNERRAIARRQPTLAQAVNVDASCTSNSIQERLLRQRNFDVNYRSQHGMHLSYCRNTQRGRMRAERSLSSNDYSRQTSRIQYRQPVRHFSTEKIQSSKPAIPNRDASEIDTITQRFTDVRLNAMSPGDAPEKLGAAKEDLRAAIFHATDPGTDSCCDELTAGEAEQTGERKEQRSSTPNKVLHYDWNRTLRNRLPAWKQRFAYIKCKVRRGPDGWVYNDPSPLHDRNNRLKMHTFRFPGLREKTAWRHLLPSYGHEWQNGIEDLCDRHDWRNPKYIQERVIEHHPDAKLWSESLLAKGSDVEMIRQQYLQLTVEERRLRWPPIMLYMLDKSPKVALPILMATASVEPKLHSVQTTSSLLVITEAFLGVPSSDSEVNAVAVNCLLEAFEWLFKQHEFPMQKVIYLVLRKASREQLQRLRLLLEDRDIVLNYQTILHFAHKYAKFGQIGDAFHFFKQATRTGARFESEEVMSVLLAILESCRAHPNGYEMSLTIAKQALQLGVPLGFRTVSSLMNVATSAGDLSYALELFKLFRRYRFGNSARLQIATLVKGCRYSNDVDTMRRVVNLGMMVADADETCAAALVHLTWLTHKNQLSGRAYSTVIPIYRRWYSMQPLYDLGIDRPGNYDDEAMLEREKWTPTIFVLTPIIYAWMGHPTQHGRDVHEIERLLHRIDELAGAGHPAIAPLVENPSIYNALMNHFGINRATLPLAVDVMRRMVKPAHTAVWVRGRESWLKPTPPNARSWSVFAACFLQHAQVQTAQQILEKARIQNVCFDVASYNQLLGAYLRLRDAAQMSALLREMKDNGKRPNGVTMKIVGKPGVRDHLLASHPELEEMEKIVNDNSHLGPWQLGSLLAGVRWGATTPAPVEHGVIPDLPKHSAWTVARAGRRAVGWDGALGDATLGDAITPSVLSATPEQSLATA